MSTTTETEAVHAAELETWDNFPFYQWADGMAGRDFVYNEEGRAISGVDRYWHRIIQDKYALHPCVVLMLQYKPKDYKQLCLEWPHVSDTDDTRIAYTRDDAAGSADRQLVTSVGKYLSRHWPHVPDHIRRDVQASYTPDRRVIVHTVPEFVMTVELGPRSCMASIYNSVQFTQGRDHQMMLNWMKDPTREQPNWELHPYACYTPELGWSMAQRWAKIDGEDRLDGRALIYTRADLPKPQFVRTYKRNLKDPQNGWSETDFALQAWLEQNGCEKVDHWPDGAQLKSAPGRTNNEIRLPYVDGTSRWFRHDPVTGIATLVVSPGGTSASVQGLYSAENTSGSVRAHGVSSSSGSTSVDDFAYDNDYEVDDVNVCEDCGAPHHMDDSYSVGRGEDRTVCPDCIDRYTLVRGYYRDSYITYRIHEDFATEVNGGDFYVDTEHPPSDVVQLDDGDWVTRDNAVYVESQDGYYRIDSDEVVNDVNGDPQLTDECVYTTDSGGYVLREDAYESEEDEGTFFQDEGARDEYDAEQRGDEDEEEDEDPPLTPVVYTQLSVPDEKFSLAA